VVAPSPAVTTTVTVVVPTASEIAPEAVPRVTATPLTVIVAALLVLLGVRVIELVVLVTEAV
jgi:hypothetical protein